MKKSKKRSKNSVNYVVTDLRSSEQIAVFEAGSEAEAMERMPIIASVLNAAGDECWRVYRMEKKAPLYAPFFSSGFFIYRESLIATRH